MHIHLNFDFSILRFLLYRYKRIRHENKILNTLIHKLIYILPNYYKIYHVVKPP